MPKGSESKRYKVTAVKVMPDFSSSCLWDLSKGYMIEPCDLGLSCKIVNALDDFERYYDDVATGRPSYCVLKKYEKKLNEMGRKIAEDIKAERPDLTVEYWGEFSDRLEKERIQRARSSVGTERDLYTVQVAGSSPVVPTKLKRRSGNGRKARG